VERSELRPRPGPRHSHFAGVVSLLSVMTLRQAGAGAGALANSQALVAINSWTFLLGQSFLPVGQRPAAGQMDVVDPSTGRWVPTWWVIATAAWTCNLPRIGDAGAAANQGGGRRRPDVEASV
jgi:hypothetical protein